ncbi:MAG: T9SS type A sorting domain-containing protein, partial [Proteobacteria bacterium]
MVNINHSPKAKKIQILEGHKNYVQGVCIDPKFKYIVTFSSDRTAKIWKTSKTKKNIALYPNPVKNNLNFSLPNGEKIAKISISNIAGQNVSNKELSQNTINLENLKAGVYVITVTNTNGISYTSKFIKE